jgi:hypothetical protein
MEETGAVGAVQLSQRTLDALGPKFAGHLMSLLEKNHLSGVKGLDREVDTHLLRVAGVAAAGSPMSGDGSPTAGAGSPGRETIMLPDTVLQQVGSVKSKFMRWKLAAEETERRLAELQRTNR